jgi:hypothetical protein
MLGWTRPRFKHRTTVEIADAEEAKALTRYHEGRVRTRELNDLVAQAARVADAVGRLGEELRHRV